jgi:DNA-binding NarL/FixJ family response regulator
MHTILLADPDPASRALLRSTLESLDCRVLIAPDGERVLAIVGQGSPDLLIVGDVLPDMALNDLLSRLGRNGSWNLPVVLVVDAKGRAEPMPSGIVHQWVRPVTANQVRDAADALLGNAHTAPSIVPSKREDVTPEGWGSLAARFARLTPREREIAALVARGLSSKEIAQSLRLSRRTVENTRAHIMRKLAVHNAAELVRVLMIVTRPA